MWTRTLSALLLIFASAAAQAIPISDDPATWEHIEIRSPGQLVALLDQQRYGPHHGWGPNSDNSVPRLYIAHIPPSWAKRTQHMVVRDKKLYFIYLLAPSVLAANEEIERERASLEKFIAVLREGGSLTPVQKRWVDRLILHYGLSGDADDPEIQRELLERVDVLPPSLVLAQAAMESGWGTSRFAKAGNSLFGEWTWGSDGIKPLEQRASKGNYRVRAFNSPLDAVRSYIHNINTHKTYAYLRQVRSEKRRQGVTPTGLVLAEGLSKYSERGMEYVEGLRALIRTNGLQEANHTRLSEMKPILMSFNMGDPVPGKNPWVQ